MVLKKYIFKIKNNDWELTSIGNYLGSWDLVRCWGSWAHGVLEPHFCRDPKGLLYFLTSTPKDLGSLTLNSA